LGSAVGYAQGVLIGEVFESVDYRLHLMLGNLSIENVNVLDNLELNIIDDVYNEGDEYVFVNEEDCVVDKIDVVKNNETIINHEDYDIYLLDFNKNEDVGCEEKETISVNFVVKKPKID
jgi:hypothetical protein